MGLARDYMTATFWLVAIGLLLANSGGTVSVLKAFGDTWIRSVQTLQGR